MRGQPQPHFSPGKDPVPIVQKAGWASGPVWTCAENIASTGIRSPDRPACRQSLCRLSYRGPLTLNIAEKYSFRTRIPHSLQFNTLNRKTVSTYSIEHRSNNFPFVFQVAEGTWQYFMLKVADLLDTVCNHLLCYSCNKLQNHFAKPKFAFQAGSHITF